MIDPVYKGRPKLGVQAVPTHNPTVEPSDDKTAVDYEGAERGEDWSLECLRAPSSGDDAHFSSPLPLREISNVSRTGVCESRPLSMTDYGESLTECEQAEQDFKKLSMELKETGEEQ